MTLALKFEIQLMSDYHISAGHGIGAEIDSALQRDPDGSPVIRGTTITGLLRDALDQLALHPLLAEQLTPVEQITTEESRTALSSDRLFGAPQKRKRWQISSARPLHLMTPQLNHTQGVGAHAAAHARIDVVRRRAQARKLFVREEAESRWRFSFWASCPFHDEDTVAEAALLTAAARMIQHLGANRRRGRGQCAIHITEIDGWATAETQDAEETLLSIFEAHWLRGQEAPKLPDINVAVVSKPDTPTDPIRVLLLARSDEPLIISARAAAGNQFESIDYIPGFVLRGALGALIAARHGLDDKDSPLYREFVRLFYRGGVQFSHLYPTGFTPNKGAIVPAIPAPLDLFISERHPLDEELSTAEHGPFSARQIAARHFRPQPQSTLKTDPAKGFLGVRSAIPILELQKSNEMHVAIDPTTGRASDENLFSYVALAPGQYFLGELIFADDSAWQNFSALANFNWGESTQLASNEMDDYDMIGDAFSVRVGKASRRGYGKLSCALLKPAAHSPLIALSIADRLQTKADPFTVTLLSDAIVQDAFGRIQQGFEPGWLSELIGFEVQIVSVHADATEELPAMEYPLRFARNRVVDTFYNHIGLPRHRDLALVAGSAVTLVATDAIINDANFTDELFRSKLAALELSGIGLRRNEGFGRVTFNHPIYVDSCQAVGHHSIPIPTQLRLETTEQKNHTYADQMWMAKWGNTLERQGNYEWQRFRKIEFTGIARELMANSMPTPAAVEALLSNYGDATKGDLFVGESIEHQKPNFFTESGKGREGMELLRRLLTDLQNEAADSLEQWQIGVKMIANRIGQEVRIAEGTGQ